MEVIHPRLTVLDVLRYLLAYACWVATALTGMLALLVIRNMVNIVWPVLGGSKWVLRPVDRFGLVFLGLVWLVYVIFMEQHYRSSITIVRVRRGREGTRPVTRMREAQLSKGTRFLKRLGLDVLAQRFVPTIVAPLVLLALAYVIQEGTFAFLGR